MFFRVNLLASTEKTKSKPGETTSKASGYATWFTAGGATSIGHYDVIDDVITQKL